MPGSSMFNTEGSNRGIVLLGSKNTNTPHFAVNSSNPSNSGDSSDSNNREPS